MEKNVADILRCEEQLRTTLHCDDKDKLRMKLVLLQREYLRTAQRLQRAERSEAVRRHVQSRITQQSYQDQRDTEVTSNHCLNPSSLTLNTQDGTASGGQGPTGGATDPENFRRSNVIRFLLPSDAACPQTPNPSDDAPGGHKPSPALRLRSRRSRLRWERRSAEAGRSTDNSQEGREQSERMETATTEGNEEGVKTEGAEVVNESEELFSSTESGSPSLLLTHWNTCGQTDMEGKETQGGQEQIEKDTEMRADGKKESGSTSLLLTCLNPTGQTEKNGQDCAQNEGLMEVKGGEEGENSEGQRDGRLCEDNSNTDTEQNAEEQIESKNSPDNTVEIKEEDSEMVGGEQDVKAAVLLDSCTLVEGLLFPVEYYVRTTRRMSSSQSQPDMHAVMLSQLNVGRHRRSRGRGRGSNRHARSDQHSQADFSSPKTASPSAGPRMESQSELNSPSSSEISDQTSARRVDTDACFSPSVTAARSARGRRRRRRGRGRGRPQTPRGSLSLDTHQLGLGQTSDDPQPTSSQVFSSPSLHGADGPKPCLTPGEAVPEPDDPQPASTHSSASQPPSVGGGAVSSSATGHQVYPIFLKTSGRTNGSTQRSSGAADWRSLLLPSTPPAQSSLLPLPSLSPGPLVNNLMNFDIPQDFHLPDDQFASLKLHKLRQVAVESAVEHFTSPSYNTRRSIRLSDACHSSSSELPHQFPLSLTPTIENSPNLAEEKQTAAQSADLQNMSIEHELTGGLANPSLTDRYIAPGEQQTENIQPERQTPSTKSESVVRHCVADCVHQHTEEDAVSASDTHGSTDRSVKSQPLINFADRPGGRVNDYVVSQSDELEIKESSYISSEEKTDCPGLVDPLEDLRSINQQTEDQSIIKTLSFDFPLRKTPEEPFNSCAAAQECDDSEAPTESPVQHLNVKSPSNESSQPTTGPPRDSEIQDKCLPHHNVRSQLLWSSPLASGPFIAPHPCSPALLSSPALPSLGLTPYPAPLTSSPSAPSLSLPPPHSPSIQALSPPALSPHPSLTFLPPSQPSTSPNEQIRASSESYQRAEPAVCPADSRISRIQSQGSGTERTKRTKEEHMMRCTHTLKAPAGGCLVDACCLLGSSGGLRVAAAGKWAVCLWSQTSASDWSLIHTWAFNEPVINVFPVPDAAGLMCVTLGQLEIREVRMLSCSGLLQMLLCEGLVQAVVGVSKSRVVTSAHSASGSTLQVFTLSDCDRTPSSQPLVSPGVCVGALAPVDGLSDALIGTDEVGRLFVWNLKTGQLLRRIILGDGLLHTACLRGYSYCGVLFVLLQHQLISSLEEEEKEAKDQMFSEEEKKEAALFSLVAVNPLSGKSVQATRLHPPKAWSGRLCEADVNSCSVVGLSQSGCVCVWELGRPGSRMVWAPESEGWQLARWGGGGMLVTGHHNGDVTLHCYSASPTPLCH